MQPGNLRRNNLYNKILSILLKFKGLVGGKIFTLLYLENKKSHTQIVGIKIKIIL